AAEVKTESTTPLILFPEPEMPVPFLLKSTAKPDPRLPACLLLHLDGKSEALKHTLSQVLLDRGWAVVAPDLRGTGETRPTNAATAGALDHNTAEHGLWMGRPLLGQWVFDVSCLLDWILAQPSLEKDRIAIVGIGQAGIVALCSAGLLEDRIGAVAAIDSLASFVTDQAYPPGTLMGLLAPGILKVGDVSHLAALSAP